MKKVTDPALLNELEKGEPVPGTELAPPAGQSPVATAPIPPMGMTPVTDPELLRALQPRPVAPEGPGTPGYSSALFPLSVNENGYPRFDPNAGILGAMSRAFRAPGDVATGKLAVFSPTRSEGAADSGLWNPEMMQRAFELAAVTSADAPGGIGGGYPIPGEMTPATPKRVAPPSGTALDAAAQSGYKAAEQSGLNFTGQSIDALSKDAQAKITEKYLVKPQYAPKTWGLLDDLAAQTKLQDPETKAVVIQPISISELEKYRQRLMRLTVQEGTSDEGNAARTALGAVSDFMSGFPNSAVDPSSSAADAAAVAATLRDARSNAATSFRSNELTGTKTKAVTGAIERADLRSGSTYSGLNYDNALRQEVAKLLRDPEKISGMSPDEILAFKEFAKGSPLRDTMRYTANFLGGGGGPWASGASRLGAGIGGGVGYAAGGPAGLATGAVLGSTLPAAGYGLKLLQNKLANNAVNRLDDLLRMRSPLYEQMAAQAAPIGRPLSDTQLLMARIAGANLPAWWGALSPPPPQSSR